MLSTKKDGVAAEIHKKMVNKIPTLPAHRGRIKTRITGRDAAEN